MSRRQPSVVIAVGFMAALTGLQGVPSSAHAGMAVSGASSVQPGAVADRPAPGDRTPCAPALVTITGWLTTVWGVAPRYWIADDQGQPVEVLLPEELTRQFGGPQVLDRQRLTISGEVVRHDPLLIRALSITPSIS